MLRAPDPDIDDVVRRELLSQSAEAARVSNLLGAGLVVTAVTVLGFGHVPWPGVIGWCALTMTWCVFFHHAVPRLVIRQATGSLTALGRRFTVIQVFAGLIWGSICVLVRPAQEQPELIAVPVAVVMLADAANLLFCNATPVAYRGYHVGIVVISSMGLASQGFWSLLAFIAFGAIGAPTLARYGYRQVAEARLLARQNALLADEVRTEREAVEQINLRLSEANAELAHKATRDPLTGLPNRALFFDHLASALVRSRQVGRRLGVIYFDLDRFKVVNDSLGHGAGDDLLRQAGARISAVLRSGDVLARLGGDEFVVLTGDRSDPTGGAGVAERVRQVLEEPFVLDGREVRVSSSLGVAVDDGFSTGEQLVEFADIALYRAKQGGRNRVARFSPSMLEPTGP
ncbi:hypothetical protein Kisp02_50280 [Kineosporia sp. NBRC 101731]|nr:hypothetical protein Kisp02_50280 [Kineosporia sp. NBRC 101731]